MRPTLRLLLVSAALKPRTCWSRVDLRFVFQHILALLDFHFSLPELLNQVSNQIRLLILPSLPASPLSPLAILRRFRPSGTPAFLTTLPQSLMVSSDA